MWLTRSMAGSAPGDLALELLAIPNAGFSEVHAPTTAFVEPHAEADSAPPVRVPRARKTPISE